MFATLIGAILVFQLFAVKYSQSYGLGSCPKIDYMADFNTTKFAGHWYEIERSFHIMELVSSCVSVDLVLKDKMQADVYLSSKSLLSGRFSLSQGVAAPTKRHPSLYLYKISSKLPRVVNRYLPSSGYYQVVDTDYEKYAILYSCTDFHLFHADLIWVWGRQKEIEVQLRTKIYQILSDNHLDSDRLTLPKNNNCPISY